MTNNNDLLSYRKMKCRTVSIGALGYVANMSLSLSPSFLSLLSGNEESPFYKEVKR